MIIKATNDHIEQILIAIEQAKEVFKINNIDQWQNGYPNIDTIKNDITLNKGYTFLIDNKVVAYFYISIDGEETYNNIYDGSWLTNKPYYVIHRLVVNKEYKNNNIASSILEYIISLAKDNNYNIRVDTHNDNIPMKRLLEKYCFKYCGIIKLLDNSLRNAYELNV